MDKTSLRKRPRRRRPGAKAAPLTAEERAAILAAPPGVLRVYRLIINRRMDSGRGPEAREVWGAYYHGNRRKWPRPNHTVGRVHDGRYVLRAEVEDPPFLLDALRPFGVRFDVDLDGTVHLTSPVYDALRPIIEAERRAAGTWPPACRYRGPKRNFR